MTSLLAGLTPPALWRHFERLSQIPRPSKQEGRAAEHVVALAKAWGLVVEREALGNVLVRKPATAGMEHRRGVVLQSHLDMVPQRGEGSTHDFARDPIRLVVDGEVLRADRTTLGADDGIGVSAALAVLESTTLTHGPLEALFTIDEETGMTGANGLHAGWLQGDVLLNLDSEDEGEICIGCAGGADLKARLAYREEPVAPGHVAVVVEVGGLMGGHSGVDIHLGRANANKVLTRLLYEANKEVPLRICRFQGGDLPNAIPRTARASVVIAGTARARFVDLVDRSAQKIRAEYAGVDRELHVVVKDDEATGGALGGELSARLLATLYASPHGVFAMVRDMPTVTETSTNLAIVDVENGQITITHMLRSSVDSKKEDVANMLTSVFSLLGAEVEVKGGYPGWKPDTKSPILAMLKDTYERRFAKPARVTATHGGLECGIIRSVYPHMDAVSIGPTVRFPHSPDEHVDIASVQRFWDFLVDVLARVPQRSRHACGPG